MTEQNERQVMRPLKILVPLIKDDLEKADEAGLPYFRAAGEKLLEAKAQMKFGEFGPWVKRQFSHITQRQAEVYMRYANATADKQNRIRTLRDSERHSGNVNYGRPASWHSDVKENIERARRDMERVREESLTRQQEREAEQKLALRLIDIGYKILAKELHPDRGGSRDAMQRLTRVRDRLKQHA
jgi:hypothetical protein